MKHPLAPVALLYTGGVILGESVDAPLAPLFAVALAAGTAALFWRKGRVCLLAALLILTGWTNMTRHKAIVSPNDLRALLKNEAADVKVRGEIRAAPSPRIFERGAEELWHTATQVRASEIFRAGNWQPAFGTIIVTTPGIPATNLFDGQTVEVSGIIQPMRGPLAEGLFDPRRYYQRQEIYYQLRADSSHDWQVVGPSDEPPASARFSEWSRRTLALGLPGEDEALRLMWTLAVDWKAPLTESVEDPFMRAGTFHIFAVDGLRIGLLAAIGIGLLRAMQIPRSVCGLLVIPVIWFYAGLTGWPASAVRAAVMMSIVIGGWAANRPVDLINSLFAAALVILLWNPQQLFQPGFQLSFIIVFCIAALVLPLRELLHARVFPPDPLLPDAIRPPWHLWLDRLRRFALDLFAMSFAAWLASMPLSAYYFHLFSPVGVPANFVVVPLTGLALMSCLGSLLAGAWFPALAVLCNHSAWFWMKCIIALSQWFARWSPGNWYVSAPGPATLLLYYLVLLTVVTGWIFRTKHKLPALAALTAAAAFWMADWGRQGAEARLDVLTLEGAPAVFVTGRASEKEALLDCGDAGPAAQITLPFLRAQGVNHLNNFGLTTGHQEAVGGADLLITNFSVPSVFAAADRPRSPAYRRLETELEQTPGRWRALAAGDSAAGWNVLHPAREDKFTRADDLALVLQKNVKGHSLLLLSSLGRDGQNALIARHPDLRAEIVVSGLPAQDEPLCDPLLDLLQPKLIIIADSEFPATRRASAKLRERLARREGVRVIYCRDAGAITLLIRNGGCEILDTGGNEPVEVKHRAPPAPGR